MNAARLDRSPRLKATLAALRQAGPRGVTTMELIHQTGSVGVACQMDGLSAGRRRVYRYRLEERAEGAA